MSLFGNVLSREQTNNGETVLRYMQKQYVIDDFKNMRDESKLNTFNEKWSGKYPKTVLEYRQGTKPENWLCPL
jgi:hypothetical protein